MINQPYDLAHEFPEYREAIHRCKMNNQHFAKLFDEYHDVARAIHRIEAGIENTSDEHTENLKKKRLRIKDELYAILQKTAA